MIFVVEVEYYNDCDNVEVTSKLFVTADTFCEAAIKIVDYYGEENMYSLHIDSFSPDNFLIFDAEDTHLFEVVKDKLGEKIIW